MSVRDLYRDRASLTKWEAEEVFKEGLKLKEEGTLDGFWEDPVTQMAKEQFNQYSGLTQEVLFRDEELGNKVYEFAQRGYL